MRALQEGLLHHQKFFLWDRDIKGDVFNNIEHELAMRSAQRAIGEGETVSLFLGARPVPRFALLRKVVRPSLLVGMPCGLHKRAARTSALCICC